MLLRYYVPTDNGDRCFYLETTSDFDSTGHEMLQWLLAPDGRTDLVSDAAHDADEDVLEVGPRLAFESPESSNRVAVCHAIPNLSGISRIETSHRHRVPDQATRHRILGVHLDPMIQTVYETPLTSFDHGTVPASVRTISVMRDGIDAIRALNSECGLGMDEADMEYYTTLFRDHYGRNPTDVELFYLGNANSEHCRHGFFKARQIIDGVAMSETLIDIVGDPLKHKGRATTVLAFNDNAGAIKGLPTRAVLPCEPGQPSQFLCAQKRRHLTATAETHNHPSGIEPYSGGATGIGGCIRDETAAGRGSYIGAAAAGFLTGNLHLNDGHVIPGEMTPCLGGESQHVSPRRFLIENSNGVFEYGNPFGQPTIFGICRTLGLYVAGERREFLKPISYCANIGWIDDDQVTKATPRAGMTLIRLGGPAYRIGMSGGGASSQIEGDAELDRQSVQRGNPEMENRVVRVIRQCAERGRRNPIAAIHDQGAGGAANALSELAEVAGCRIDLDQITSGDQTLSDLERFVAEYQEGYAVLVYPELLEDFQVICSRERVPCDVVGEVTGDGVLTVHNSATSETSVSLRLDDVFGKLPQKEFSFERPRRRLDPVGCPPDLSIAYALERIFRLPSVGSKGFLTRKVDRSVTGKVVQQQCCGPLQVPVADAAVTASGYFDTVGAVAAIGETPTKMLVDPRAGARMAVAEMLLNMVGTKIPAITQISCRANWMWPAKLDGEGAMLYDAADAMRTIMCDLSIAIDGGKDSISMASKPNQLDLVKAPGELVVLGYAPVPDTTRVLTPELSRPGESRLGLIDLGKGKNRLGGSALAQSFGQVGDTTPDIENPDLLRRTFEAVQELIECDLISAVHDRSDGGLITTVAEMCFAGNCGAVIERFSTADPIPTLFSEEAGLVIEYTPGLASLVSQICDEHNVPLIDIGYTTQEKTLTVSDPKASRTLFSAGVAELRRQWEATSTRLEKEQASSTTADAEYERLADMATPPYRLTFDPPQPHTDTPVDPPKVAVLRDEGTNGDREMAAALMAAGLDPWDITMEDLIDSVDLDQFQGVVFPGGFTYKDVFGAGKGWAGVIRFNERLTEMFRRFYERPDTFSLGVCNGCQVMAHLGWVPWPDILPQSQPRFVVNDSGRFESRFSWVEILPSPSIMLQGMEGSRLGVWVAHGEGKLSMPDQAIAHKVRQQQLAPLAYVDPDGQPTEQYPYNPNGSPSGLTALCSKDGRHLAMMPHPERCFQLWQWGWVPPAWRDLPASPWLEMFTNARRWCERHQEAMAK